VKALVTDAHHRNALAGIRGLGRARHEVLALGPRRTAGGLWSRHTSARSVHRSGGPGALAARVAECASEHGPVVVYPGAESSIDALVGADPPLPATAVLPYPDAGALELLRDKRGLAALAAEVGLATPATLVEATAAELRGWDPPAPCVVKPAAPCGALPTARAVGSGEELRALLATLPTGEPLLVQERARPPLVSLAVVMGRGGELVARFQQEARRTWPPDAGMSSLAVSVTPDGRLTEQTAAMLRDARFGGLAQLQFVQVDRGPALIDVNPRFYGSMALALACGVNLPAAWHAAVTGERAGGPASYRVGVSYRWLEGELLTAVRGASGPAQALRRSAAVLAHPPPRPRTGAIWAGQDPLPGVLMAAELIGGIAARRLGRGTV